jgi:Family of unknown function (DUF6049)
MRRALAALIALAAVAVTADAHTADAGPTATTTSTEPTITLLSQPAWVPMGGSMVLGLDASPPNAGYQVRYSLYGEMTARTTFDETLTGNQLGELLARNVVNYESLLPSEGGGRGLFLGLQSPSAPADGGLPITGDGGVYPLAIDLIDAEGNTLDGFVTYVVAVEPATIEQPTIGAQLRVTWVWPLQAAPALLADGSPAPAVIDELLPSGRVGRQIAALMDAPGVDVTLAPGPETVDTWTSLAREERRLRPGIADLNALANRNEVLTGPYVQLDYPAIIAGGLGSRVEPELVAGAGALQRNLEAEELDPRVAIVRPASTTALTQLRGLGIDQVFVDASALASESFGLTPARPFALQLGDDTQITGAAGDPTFESLLTADAPAALRAQQILAGLSLVAFETPNVARGIPLVNPEDWAPSRRFLDAMLAGLTEHPLLDPASTSDFFELGLEPAADGAGILVRQLAPAPPPDEPPVTADTYFNAFAEQQAFRDFLGDGDPKLVPGDRALLVSLSAAYQSDFGRLQAAAELDVIPRAVDAEMALIRVPEEGTVTLTARQGDVPVTFLNETGREVRVRVDLNSQQLQFPDGDTREVTLPPRSTTVRFAVEARTQGNYPLTLHVTTVDGGLPVSSTRVNVRSTFVSGVGKFLTVGAVVFLALWWGLDIRRRRRRKRAEAPTTA